MKKREIILRSRKDLDLADSYRLFLRISNLNVSPSIRLSDTEIEVVTKIWLMGVLLFRDELRDSLGLKSNSDLANRLSKLSKKGYLENRGKGIMSVSKAWNLPKDLEVLKLGLIINVTNGESKAADSE
jgi:hypothetical protein